MYDRRRYFDHAATSFPKAPGVLDAMREYFDHVGVSPGRGAYAEAVEAGRMVENCRNAIRNLLNSRADDHVIFALNGTDALNLAIKGTARPGAHMVTTVMDHNSVLRPMHALAERDRLEFTAIEADPASTIVDPAAVRGALRPNTALVAVTHASNVTGAIQPVEEIGAICRERGIRFLVDAAQSAGHLPIDVSRIAADYIAFPGHKGLLGPSGTGVLWIRGGAEKELLPLREGGTGSQSEHPRQPDFAPDRFEAGSHNSIGIAGLLAALRFIRERGVAALREHELRLCERLAAGLERCEGVKIFGPRKAEQRTGVFTIRVPGLEPAELAAILEEQFGVLTRSGLHCAPWAHRCIGTDSTGGATRLSIGAFTTEQDVDYVCAAIAEVIHTLRDSH
jgi:cysteine desulfurase / selenocysteine lyase